MLEDNCYPNLFSSLLMGLKFIDQNTEGLELHYQYSNR